MWAGTICDQIMGILLYVYKLGSWWEHDTGKFCMSVADWWKKHNCPLSAGKLSHWYRRYMQAREFRTKLERNCAYSSETDYILNWLPTLLQSCS